MGLSTEVSIIPHRQGNSEELNAVVWEGDRAGWKANPMTLNGNLNASNTEILEKKGFEVISVRCKAGVVPKEQIGIKPDEKLWGPGYWETM